MIEFEKVPLVEMMLKSEGLEVHTVSDQIKALTDTFNSMQKLFMMVTFFIFGVALFISILLIVKLTNSRFREIGLLSALGYSKENIRSMLMWETSILCAVALLTNAVTIGLAVVVIGGVFDISVAL